MSEFNLIEEKWIPVLYHDGRLDRVGIQTAFTKAGNIRQIAASNPMDRVAVLRFLLAVLYWCLGNPREGQDGYDTEVVCHKLEENRGCFNLLGKGKRFYQVRFESRVSPVASAKLFHELPAGDTVVHFRHLENGREGFCPSCVRSPSFDGQL